MEISTQYPNTQQSTGVHYAPYQSGSLRTGNFNVLAHMPGHLGTVTASLSSGRLFGVQNHITNPETDQSFTGPIRSLHGGPNLVEHPGSMLQSTEIFSQPASELTEGSAQFPSAWFPDVVNNIPSTMGIYSCLNVNQVRASQHLGFGGQEISTFGDAGSSGYMNDQLWPPSQDPYLIPLENDRGYAEDDEFVESCVANIQHATQCPIESLTIPTSDSMIGTTATNIHLPSANGCLSLQTEVQSSFDYFRIGINDSLSSFLSNQLSDPDLHVSNDFEKEERSLQLTFVEADNPEPTTVAESPLKRRRLVPKPSGILDNTGNVEDNDTSRKGKKRRDKRGPLPGDQRAKRAKMRGKACAKCFVSHLACSFEDPCKRCVANAPSPFSEISCNRGTLLLYFEVFSPQFLNSHLSVEAIKMDINRLEFFNSEVEVHVSTGTSHPLIKLWAREYTPPSRKSVNNSPSNIQDFADLPSLNYGVPQRNVYQLELRSLEHIKAISSRSTVIGNQETFSQKILNAILQFQQSDVIAGQNGLLANAIEVNRLHYVLGRMILLRPNAAFEAMESHQNEAMNLPAPPLLGAGVLARQIKGAMVSLLDIKTNKLLEDFDGEVKRQTAETSLLCVLTQLIMCTNAELIQSQVDGFVAFRISRGNCDAEMIRKFGIEICRRIENDALKHFWQLLRGKIKNRFKKRNPFQSGVQSLMDEEEEGEGGVVKETERTLINKIREIMVCHALEIRKKASSQLYGGASRTPEDVKNFQVNNSGRLLAKCLIALEKGE